MSGTNSREFHKASADGLGLNSGPKTSKDYWPIKQEDRKNQKYCARCLGLMGFTYVSGKITAVCGGCGGRKVRKD